MLGQKNGRSLALTFAASRDTTEIVKSHLTLADVTVISDRAHPYHVFIQFVHNVARSIEMHQYHKFL